jgi:hypothetical protein
MIRAIVALIAVLISTHARSQSFQSYPLFPINGGFNGPSPTGTPLPTDQVLLNRLMPGNSFATTSLQLGSFASANDVQALSQNIDNSNQNIQNQLYQVYLSNQSIQNELSRLSEGVALASALTILPPNPGDRYNITFSGAGYNLKAAVSVSGSYRFNEQALLFAAYARSQTENLVKGGVSFSFK